MKTTNRIIIYKDKTDHDEIAIKCTLRECFEWGGLGICDLCNNISKEYVYLCPELGHKGLCEQCFEEHKQRVKWYPEDIKYLKDTLNTFIQCYGLSFSPADKSTINDFITSIDKEVQK